MIGLHLLVDGVMERRAGRDDVEGMLRELPGRIGMHILAGPVIVEGHPDNPGWTGFVIIDKSHISIHTFDDGNLISIDVFSCKPFDSGAVTEYLNAKIQMSCLRARTVEREPAY